MSKRDLRPCPFCGAEAELVYSGPARVPEIHCSNDRCFVAPSVHEDHFLFRLCGLEEMEKKGKEELKDFLCDWWNGKKKG